MTDHERCPCHPGQVFPWRAEEAAIFARSAESPDDIDAIILAHAEWERAVLAACRSVGLTWHELWEHSLDDSFPSLRARKLWLAIGYHT